MALTNTDVASRLLNHTLTNLINNVVGPKWTARKICGPYGARYALESLIGVLRDIAASRTTDEDHYSSIEERVKAYCDRSDKQSKRIGHDREYGAVERADLEMLLWVCASAIVPTTYFGEGFVSIDKVIADLETAV